MGEWEDFNFSAVAIESRDPEYIKMMKRATRVLDRISKKMHKGGKITLPVLVASASKNVNYMRLVYRMGGVVQCTELENLRNDLIAENPSLRHKLIVCGPDLFFNVV